jgi:hypothetical protein
VHATRPRKERADQGVAGIVTLPASVVRLGVRWARHAATRHINLYVTKVPGPPGPLYLAGSRLLGAVPIAPLVAGVRLSVTALFYDGQFVVSLLADDALDGLPALADGVQSTLAGNGGAGPTVASDVRGGGFRMTTIGKRAVRGAAALLVASALAETVLVRLGRTYGSTPQERAADLPGDDNVPRPHVVTDHAITIDAPPECVWPWPSATRIVPELQGLHVGDFVPDGAPETRCGFVVERLEPHRALVLHSISHLPLAWRERHHATLDWSWAFVLRPVDGGRRTRFSFRSRWSTAPWWFTLGGRLLIVPADFLMSRDMLLGVKQRAEALSVSEGLRRPTAVTTRAVAR